jgi:hypothetical protein
MELERTAHCAGIDLSTWGFADLNDELSVAIGKIVSETVRDAFAENPPSLYWPTIWRDHDGKGGPPAKDPLTIDLSLPLGETNERDEVVYRFTLGDLVDDLLRDVNGTWSDRDAEILERVANLAGTLLGKLSKCVEFAALVPKSM